MKQTILAWDIGGAHLKAAYLSPEGELLETGEWTTPIWQGLDSLEGAMQSTSEHFRKTEQVREVATTTAELVDLFLNRSEGINILAGQLKQYNQKLSVYAGANGFITLDDAERYKTSIASANWHATASFVASKVESGVLLDMGSTTTDIIAFKNHKLLNSAYSDHERLLSRELVYSGVLRTPVMAAVSEISLHKKAVPVMAELFATLADVYRLTGELHSDNAEDETSDGRDGSLEASARRLARMIGLDLGIDISMKDVVDLAIDVSEQQLDKYEQALEQQLRKLNNQSQAIIVAAGHGRIIIKKLADRMNLEYLNVEDLYERVKPDMTPLLNCATAVSLAYLARDQI